MLLAITVFMSSLSWVTAVAHAELPICPWRETTLVPEAAIPHRDCRLHSTDGSGLKFDVTYWSAGDTASPLAVRVVVLSPSGGELQTINELLEISSPSPVGLEDVDGDGRDELLIPISQRKLNGANNTRFSLWRAEKEATHFERTQMMGQAVYRSGDGYVVTNSGALSSRDLDFYLPTAAGYTQIVTITISAEDIDLDTRKVRTARCVAHKQAGLGAIDMDWRDSPVFCESPAARAIWPDAQRI
ncbi:hypothetical protein [Mycobacteroides saopaulense]|uniref:Alpha integrin n=1 Tax=Mycobacteroides saopaulense TaxID=1578165 RepID=A0ABX3BZ51_9MYCO|nr:hypothetical protein [Mycobacteroides saopaulense]OHT81485.1 hypothetical protein BKG68_21265 [Mycobacteroides saopaulense]OHU09013.1 hypothetical protein BKG73_13225 [Mycobacteroides saopaulense]